MRATLYAYVIPLAEQEGFYVRRKDKRYGMFDRAFCAINESVLIIFLKEKNPVSKHTGSVYRDRRSSAKIPCASTSCKLVC